MRRLLTALAATLVLFLAPWGPGASWTTVEAFEPPYDRLLPQSGLSKVVPAVKANDHTVRFEVQNTSGLLPRFLFQATDALATGSPYAGSYGNVAEGLLKLQPVDVNPHIIIRAESTAVYSTFCGGSWSIGCAQWWTLPGVAHIRAAAMTSWGDVGVAAVVIHEAHHIIATACDQYLQAPPGNDVADANDECVAYNNSPGATCTGNPDTVMDCGLAARTLQLYDLDTIRLRYGIVEDPRGPQEVVGKDGRTVIRWGACNDLDQRFTSDISVNGSAGVWSPENSLIDWTSAMGWTRVPDCP